MDLQHLLDTDPGHTVASFLHPLLCLSRNSLSFLSISPRSETFLLRFRRRSRTKPFQIFN